MDWLKNIIGDELYGELEANGTIEKLKGKFGETQYIPHDKDKWIEKHVFNNQREELKTLKEKNKEYETELQNRSNLITENDHKVKLSEMETTFKAKQKALEDDYNNKLLLKSKENALLNLLTSNGCRKPQYLLNSINYEDVILKDSEIVNGTDIVNGFKADVPEFFGTNQNPNIPPKGQGSKTTKEQLIELYNKATPGAQRMAIGAQIKSLDENK